MTRKLKLYIASSLDGYIARKDGGIDWLFTDADYGYEAFYASIDTILIGRKTYEQVLTFGEYPYPDKISYVFSRRTSASKDDENIHMTAQSPENLLAELQSRSGKDIWLLGGGDLVQSCLDKDLVDELILSIHPVLLGSGIALFPEPVKEKPLKFIESTSFSSGLVQLHYQIMPSPSKIEHRI